VKPQKALELIQSQKYAYVDVRTKHEFETVGHHKNSTCIPYFVSMGPPPEVNPDFIKEVEMKFPRKDCPLLIGCAAGGRSAKASATLREAGYTNIADLEGGFKAWASEFGDMIETGCGC
jgi:rhodanese-related sulfurtransferase|tara:strand:+ start:751 stop:1107 length:357 start_codon:yes stop_codon:yes gene_type:complete